MAIRVIYAPLTGGQSDNLVFAAAGAAAQQFAAHVDVVFQRIDPRTAIPYLGEGISGDVVAQFVENAEKENAALAQRAHTEFNVWRGRVGLALAETPAETEVATCSWRESGGLALNDAGDARLADLVIAARGKDAGALESESTFEMSLMHSGRPVLLVGSAPGRKLGNRVLIAWNGSAEASRAIAAAMPFLRMAQSVTAITAPESSGLDSASSESLTRYLAWHGIAVEAKVARDDGDSVGETLLNEADRCAADLLVMGAYGHSRLREYVLGGATRYILDEGTLPVLMTH